MLKVPSETTLINHNHLVRIYVYVISLTPSLLFDWYSVEMQHVQSSLDVVVTASATAADEVYDASLQTYYLTHERETKRIQCSAKLDMNARSLDTKVGYTLIIKLI